MIWQLAEIQKNMPTSMSPSFSYLPVYKESKIWSYFLLPRGLADFCGFQFYDHMYRAIHPLNRNFCPVQKGDIFKLTEPQKQGMVSSELCN